MKQNFRMLLGSLILAGLAVAWTGCIVPGGRGGGYGGTVWFPDGPWLDGGGRGGHGGYVHPGGGGRHR